METRKRIAALTLSLLAVILLLPSQVFAAGDIDLNQTVGLTVSYQDHSKPLVGAEFDIYLVATVDQYGELTATQQFAQFNVSIRGKNDAAWRTLASTLEGYVLRDAITPTDSGKTDRNGLISFPTGKTRLTPGLYLVLGHRHTQNGFYYDALPFMVMLPQLDKENNIWIYEVTANAKFDSTEIPSSPGTVIRKVLKVWDDSGHETERPREVVVQLLRNGKVYDTVILNAKNNWRYTWRDLDSSCQWTVVEKELEDYTVSVTREGITFVVTNSYDKVIPDTPAPERPPDKPEKPSNSKPGLPQTGQLWWPVPLLVAAGLLFIIIGLVQRRGAADE